MYIQDKNKIPPYGRDRVNCTCLLLGTDAFPFNLAGQYRYTRSLLALDGLRPPPTTMPPAIAKIVTPLNEEAWKVCLQAHPDQAFAKYILKGRVSYRGRGAPGFPPPQLEFPPPPPPPPEIIYDYDAICMVLIFEDVQNFTSFRSGPSIAMHITRCDLLSDFIKCWHE